MSVPLNKRIDVIWSLHSGDITFGIFSYNYYYYYQQFIQLAC